MACTHKGGAVKASKMSAAGTNKNPKTNIRKTAGPSALSLAAKSSPQFSQVLFNVKSKVEGYNDPSPHLGHRQAVLIFKLLKKFFTFFLMSRRGAA